MVDWLNGGKVNKLSVHGRKAWNENRLGSLQFGRSTHCLGSVSKGSCRSWHKGGIFQLNLKIVGVLQETVKKVNLLLVQILEIALPQKGWTRRIAELALDHAASASSRPELCLFLKSRLLQKVGRRLNGMKGIRRRIQIGHGLFRQGQGLCNGGFGNGRHGCQGG